MNDPRPALRKLRDRVKDDNVFGAAEAVELLNILVDDEEERTEEAQKVADPPDADKTNELDPQKSETVVP